MNSETDNLLSSALNFVRDCGDKSMLLCAKVSNYFRVWSDEMKLIVCDERTFGSLFGTCKIKIFSSKLEWFFSISKKNEFHHSQLSQLTRENDVLIFSLLIFVILFQ